MMRKGSDASSGFFSESFSSQNGLKSPPPLGNNEFKTRKLQYIHKIICGKFTCIDILCITTMRTHCCMNKLGRSLNRVTCETERNIRACIMFSFQLGPLLS